MQRVATTVIEVKDARVVNFLGDYAAYLASVTGEIDAAEAADESRQRGPRAAARQAPPPAGGPAKAPPATGAAKRDLRKQLATLEKSITRLDAEKKTLQARLLETTDAAEALRLHTTLADVAGRLSAAEEEWLMLQESAGAG
jgi:hypothetical protein